LKAENALRAHSSRSRALRRKRQQLIVWSGPNCVADRVGRHDVVFRWIIDDVVSIDEPDEKRPLMSSPHGTSARSVHPEFPILRGRLNLIE
jgi:hypothetical protein